MSSSNENRPLESKLADGTPKKKSLRARIGWIFVIAASTLLLFTYGKIIYEELRFQTKRVVPALQSETLIPVDKTFGIVIPKLGANAKVIKDVDPYNDRLYQQALTKGVAHAKGSSLPDREGNVFLFSHSSVNFYEAMRYNSIFYLLNKLENGDAIDIYYNDTKYEYKVTKKAFVASNAVEYLRPTIQGHGAHTLTLMTCWPPGTSFKRLIIVGERIK